MRARRAIGVVLVVAAMGALYLALREPRGGRRASGELAPVEPPAPAAELARLSESAVEAGTDGVAPHDESRASVETAPVEQAPEPIEFEMRVRVTDLADGKPLEGAAVTYFDRAAPDAERTDENGVCFVELARPDEKARLRVQASGYLDWSLELSAESVSVQLARSAKMVGRILAADTGEAVRDAELELSLRWLDGCEVVRTRSRENGAFELAPVPLRTAAILEVRARGFAVTRRDVELRSAGDEPLRQDIHLVRGVELAGVVEDWVTGRGLSGARVEELPTREDGSFDGFVRVHPVTGWTSFDVVAAGYATLRVDLGLVKREEPLVFRLPQLASIEGEVRDALGQPFPGASVSFWSDGPMCDRDGTLLETSPLYELPEGWTFELLSGQSRVPIFTLDDGAKGRGTSDAGGQYRFAVLPWVLGGRASLSLGRAPVEARPLPPLEPGTVRRLDWRAPPDSRACRVQGIVTLNGQRGEAFTGTVSWRGAAGSGSRRLDSVHKTSFHFDVEVAPGDLAFTAVLDLLPELPSPEIAVRVRPGEQRYLTIDIVAPTPPEDAIRGSVRFTDGSPVADAEVSAWCALPGDAEEMLGFQAFTGARGEYELRVVDLGLPFAVFTGIVEQDSAIDSVHAGDRDVDFVLPRQHRLQVRVREARTGAALVLGEDVQLAARTDRYPAFRPLETAWSDADGWYEFWVEADEIDLLAQPASVEMAAYGTRLLESVRLGRAGERVEMELAPGLELTVQLDGEPWPSDHWLYLIPERLWDEVRESGTSPPVQALIARGSVEFDAGRATLHGLSPGPYRFKAFPGDLLLEPPALDVGPGTSSASVRWSRAE